MLYESRWGSSNAHRGLSSSACSITMSFVKEGLLCFVGYVCRCKVYIEFGSLCIRVGHCGGALLQQHVSYEKQLLSFSCTGDDDISACCAPVF